MEDNFKIFKVEYLSNHWLKLAQILNLSLYDQTKVTNTLNADDHLWKMTLIRRKPQNIDSGISQQPLIGSCSNCKLKLMWPNKSEKYTKLRWPLMEDDLN